MLEEVLKLNFTNTPLLINTKETEQRNACTMKVCTTKEIAGGGNFEVNNVDYFERNSEVKYLVSIKKLK